MASMVYDYVKCERLRTLRNNSLEAEWKLEEEAIKKFDLIEGLPSSS